MSETIDLLEKIRNLPRESRLLFTSYNFQQNFFEKHIFPVFKGRTLPIVIIDYHDYIQNIKQNKSRNVETRYFLNSIKLNGSFHPKIVLSSTEENLEIIIGSSNITHGGYAINAEINGLINLEYQNNQYPGVITKIQEFLDELAVITKSEPHKKQIMSYLDFIKKETKKENENIWLLHNFKQPIFEQLFQKINSEIKEIHVISPFFSQSKKFYDYIFDKIKCPINFIVQKGNNNLPIEILKTYPEAQTTFKTISFENPRNLHAKIIIIKTKNESLCLFGSANFTSLALQLIPKNGGNVEMCVLRKEEDPNYFNYILESKNFKLKNSNLTKVESVNIPMPSKEKFDFTINHASISNKELSISFDKEINEEYILVSYIFGWVISNNCKNPIQLTTIIKILPAVRKIVPSSVSIKFIKKPESTLPKNTEINPK